MDKLKGVVERLTFVNEDNGFSVIKVKAYGYPELITVVGKFAAINPGAIVEFQGKWHNDAKYGKQFLAEYYQETMPATVAGIEKYLGSGMIKGVGPVTAKRIVRQFKEDTITLIDMAPHRLCEVPGIGQKRVEMITAAWQEHREIKNVMIFLQTYGVSTTYAIKIFREYKEKSIEIVKENPYRLADDIWGIGFRTADKIALKMGFAMDSPFRCKAALVYLMNEFSDRGDCYTVTEELVKAAKSLLETDNEELIRPTIEVLVAEQKLIREDDDKLYLPPLYFCETGVANSITELNSASYTPLPEELEKMAKIIGQTEAANKVHYDEVQREAVRAALSNRFMVLTGGPGTGKTTTTAAIINVFEKLGARIFLAAPTGRAAKRLSEATRREAKTVHRMLEIKPPDGYKKNKDNPLECEVLIVDEASMLDIVLTHNLLKAVKTGTTVILVGDVDQLPSVGPGNVLKDIIASGVVHTVSLTRIFRQAMNSDIVKNAHQINAGYFPDISNKKDTDFFFQEKEDPDAAALEIIKLCKTRLPSYYGIDPLEDIQVLCPMTKGQIGSHSLNAALQEALNQNTLSVKYGNTTYKLGDKVMQTRNNYDKSVFNGDIGKIVEIDQEARSVTIRFDNLVVEYDVSDLDEVVLAYAVTVHKSQGSEYKIVVCPVMTQHYMLLQRNLIYTAVTRAKKAIVLVGTKKALGMAVKNNKSEARKTLLARRLRESCGVEAVDLKNNSKKPRKLKKEKGK